MGEVKAQTLRLNQRTRLIDMVAEHFLKRLVQQMGRGMILDDVLAQLLRPPPLRPSSPLRSTPDSTTHLMHVLAMRRLAHILHLQPTDPLP